MTKYLVSINDLKKLFSQINAVEVLRVLGIKTTKIKAFKVLQENWDYDIVLKITRDIAIKPGGKYNSNKISELVKKREELISQYQQQYGDELDWVFNPSGFDDYRAKYTRGELVKQQYLDGVEKHTLVAGISEVTSQLCEVVLVNQNPEIFPTLKNTKGADYLYKYQFRDWKNAKSIGKEFIKEQEREGKNPLEVAFAEPEKVGKWMYENQSDARFGFEPRHFLIYTSNKIISTQSLITKLSKVNFDSVYPITFTRHKTGTEYTTSCLVTYI